MPLSEHSDEIDSLAVTVTDAGDDVASTKTIVGYK